MKRIAVLLAVPLCLLAANVALSAPDSPTAAVSYRKAVMKGMSGHAKALGLIAKGEAASRQADAAFHAEALAASGRIVCDLFPAGTGMDVVPESHAKAEIWSTPDEFKTACEAYKTETAKLVTLAKKTDMVALKDQMGKVGEACGGCHDKFEHDEE